jgi:hypothetical protein
MTKIRLLTWIVTITLNLRDVSSPNINLCQRVVYQVDNWRGCTVWTHSGIVGMDIDCMEGGPVTKDAQIVFGMITSNPFSV